MDLSSNIMLSKMVCIYGLSNIPMECLKFGHGLWYCLCWCSLSFDISMRAEVSTLRKVVMTGHKQESLMGRPRVLHTNIRIVNLSQSLGTDFFWPNPTIKSTHQVIQKNKVESQLFHISTVLKKPAFASPDASPGPGTDSPSPWTTQKKNWIKITRNQSKKKRLGAKSSNWMWWKLPIFGR